MDLGASTGGFTDCLLQHGAARVTCVDVGYGELDWRLREDRRVIVMERVNARRLHPAALQYRPDLVAMDLSFISLAKVLPAVVACSAPRFDLLALVKPQFELGRGRVGKGGSCETPTTGWRRWSPQERRRARWGSASSGTAPRACPGPAGNRESFMWCTEPERGGVEDLITAAREAELEPAAP